MTIREMELEDLPAVYALGRRLYTADRWPTLYRTWDEYDLVVQFASEGELCLVAEHDGAVVGFALGSLIEKRRSAWRYGYLEWLGVAPEVSGRGVARRLLQRLTDLFIDAGARMMLVDTEADNERAIEFFRRAGFGNPVDHVYLSKNLTSSAAYRERRTRTGAARRVRRPAVPPSPEEE